jgi:DNA-binding NarL/FixJ family response regulator
MVILVFDTKGPIFEILRGLDLAVPLWRVTDPSRLERTERVDLAVVAAYARGAWDPPGQRPSCDTMIVTTQFDTDEALLALGRGFVGYVSDTTNPAALRATILGCLAGEPGYERRTLGRWLRTQVRCVRSHASDALLTARQRQVLKLVAEGLADKEIAERLGIATVTAQKHVTNILDRLHVPNRAAAVATVCGLIDSTRFTMVRALPQGNLAAAS